MNFLQSDLNKVSKYTVKKLTFYYIQIKSIRTILWFYKIAFYGKQIKNINLSLII